MDVVESSMDNNVSELVKFFHSFPHYNTEFEPVEPVFNIEDQSYLESLLLIVAVPVAWMLLWILIYIVYFCYFCITCRKQRAEKSQKSGKPTKWFSFFFAILAMLSLTASLFGTEIINTSLKSAASDLMKIKSDLDNVSIKTAVILRPIDTLILETVPFLSKKFRENPALDSVMRPLLVGKAELLKEDLQAAGDLMREVQLPLKQLKTENQNHLTSALENYELYRRWASHALTGFLILTTALSLCSLGGRKKGFILGCVAVTIFNLMIVWMAAGLYTGLGVATADLCMNTTAYVTAQTSDDGESTIRYFLDCQPSTNPFHEFVIEIQSGLHSSEVLLKGLGEKEALLDEIVVRNITEARAQVRTLKQQLLEFSSLTDCSLSHRNYASAVDNICNSALVGEAVVIGSYGLAGTFMIILVFLIHATARYTSNRRAYVEVDSQDDFESRDHHNRSDNPLYYRFSQISTTDDNTRVAVSTSPQPTAPPRSSPPPAYQNHKDFYSTYGNNGTLDSNTRAPSASNDLNRNSNTFRT